MKTVFGTSAKNINRATILDGKLLNRFVVEPLSARDEDVLSNINEMTPLIQSVYQTVQDNYQSNWPNSNISGFNTFKIGSYALTGEPHVAGTIALSSSDEIQVRGNNAAKALTITATRNMLQSYYARAMAMHGYIDDDHSVAFNDCSATVSSFAYGHAASAHNWRYCIK